ncbi:MAG TPA: hypothetical protein VM940_12410 [Chthoniobacterales bacterium]|jgi:hypothetical protein|nr:hypothetical protein [Chthoniobacterales bacterium]
MEIWPHLLRARPTGGGAAMTEKMRAAGPTKKEKESTLRAFLIELAVYAAFVTAYFFLVLHYLSGWLQNLHLHHVKLYALVTIVLIIGQAVLLESVTTWLLRLLRGRSE